MVLDIHRKVYENKLEHLLNMYFIWFGCTQKLPEWEFSFLSFALCAYKGLSKYQNCWESTKNQSILVDNHYAVVFTALFTSGNRDYPHDYPFFIIYQKVYTKSTGWWTILGSLGVEDVTHIRAEFDGADDKPSECQDVNFCINGEKKLWVGSCIWCTLEYLSRHVLKLGFEYKEK